MTNTINTFLVTEKNIFSATKQTLGSSSNMNLYDVYVKHYESESSYSYYCRSRSSSNDIRLSGRSKPGAS